MTLTKQDINALRLATDVFAQLHEGQHVIKGVKRPTFAERERNPYADDVYHTIEVEGRVDNYERDDAPVTAAFTNMWGSRGVWEFVRVGDKLTLLWVRGNYSDVTRDSGLAVDELYVVVTRGEGSKRKEYRFMLAAHTGLKNSARMVRSASEGH